jgi:hypothetical protein
MRIVFALLLAFLSQAAEPRLHQLDLEPMLHDPAALEKLTIMYQPPGHSGWSQVFFVRGDGSAILQACPDYLMANTDVPTCRAKVSQDMVKDLVRQIIRRHFFELSEKQFIFLYAAQSNEKLELHTIAIDDGHGKVSRTFGIGKFGDKEETIPPDFSSIEDELKRLRDFAFPARGKPCRLAPAIKFWQ